MNNKFLITSILALASVLPAHAAEEYIDNTLLVMPNSSDQETKDIIKDVDGTIIETIGSGKLLTWVIKFKDTKKFSKAENKLTKDKKFRNVQRDAIFHEQQAAPDDPYFPQQWHLNVLKVPQAWAIHNGGNVVIASIDHGINYSNVDLTGKVLRGYSVKSNKTGTFSDRTGHGTRTMTCAAALTNNGKAVAAPAKLATILPVTGEGQYYSSSKLIKAFDYIGNKTSVKLVNCSLNNEPPNSFGNAAKFPALHQYLKWYHDQKGGLIFNAGGNYSKEDPASFNSYFIVVQAVDESIKRVSWSNWGKSTWFTAPGTNIWTTYNTSTIEARSGTSYSSPLACSIAAMVWAVKPSLKNTQVESILKQSCIQPDGIPAWNQIYGWGMPQADKAVELAKGM